MAEVNSGAYFGENSWRAAVQLIKTALAGVASPDDADAALAAQKTEIMAEINSVKESIKNEVTDSKGVANGLAPLDDTGKVPSAYLPSYVDDVIEGTLGTDGVFMSNPDPDVEGSVAEAITGEKGKIYVDTATNFSYRWSGSQYVKIESNDLVEITADDVQAMWDEISGNTGA